MLSAGVLFEKAVILTLSALVGFTVFYSVSKVLEQDYKSSLNVQAESAINYMESVERDAYAALRNLNTQGYQNCAPDTLVAMRKRVFTSKFIKDIGFFNNEELVCTTGVGVLDTPVKESAPDFTGPENAQIWVNRDLILFNNDISAFIVKLGNFNAVINREVLDKLIVQGSRWELAYLSANGIIGVAGNKGVYEAVSKGDVSVSRHINVFKCSETSGYCMVISSPQSAFHQNYQLTLQARTLFSVLFALFFYALMAELVRRYRSVDARISRGLSKNAFYCVYQPIVDLHTGEFIGCEVLARYRDTDGEIYPDTFIPMIITKDKTWPFTKAIIRRVIEDIAASGSLPPGFKVNINFFAQDISNGNILELVENRHLTQLDLHWVVEVTENEKLCEVSSLDVLQTLSENGFQVAIDDFGTGYSNLQQVRSLRCDTIKIDRSFVSEMEDGSVRSTLIPHIVDIADKLNVNIVAEGIENNMQSQALIELGIKYGQGYMYGKPMALDKLLGLLQQQSSND